PGDDASTRMRGEEPRRRRCGRRGEVDGDVIAVQQVEEVVEPLELELTLPWLQQRPREDADADEIHPGLAHEGDVLVPRLTRPLLGVVVSPVPDPPPGRPSAFVGHDTPFG